MQSLFVKCQKCQQRPATIKCMQCRYGQAYRLCYSCDSQIHNRTGPIDQQHKTEIIPYQATEMYQKNQNIVPVPQKSESRNSFKKNEFKPQIPTKDYMSNDIRKPDYSKTIDYSKKPELVETKHNYLDKRIESQDKRQELSYGYEKKPYSSSQKQPPHQEPDRGSQVMANQLRVDNQELERLKSELQQSKDREKDATRKLQKVQAEYDQKHNEDQQRLKQLQDENKSLNQRLSQTNRQHQDEMQKFKKHYEEQILEMERQLDEKTQELEEKDQQLQQIGQEYNLEELQQGIEEIQQESQMKDQIIEQLQNQLGDMQDLLHKLQSQHSSSSAKKHGQSQDQQKDELIQELQNQLEARDEECRKLEELIENFKSLYGHMNDEKQQLQEEVDRLSNENNQFREIFSQNLHLFGIDPNQLNEEGEMEGEEGEYPEQIAEENDDQND